MQVTAMWPRTLLHFCVMAYALISVHAEMTAFGERTTSEITNSTSEVISPPKGVVSHSSEKGSATVLQIGF